MDKGTIAKTLATLSVAGLLAGATIVSTGCAGTGSCSSCTQKTEEKGEHSCGQGSCGNGSCGASTK